MKVLISGAHFTPAQAVIERLKKFSETSIVYVGRRHTFEGDKVESLESKVLPRMGVKFISLNAGRFSREFSLYTLISFLKIPVGFVQAFFIILREQPDVVVSFGGYVGLPVVFCSWLLSKPVIVHEQTLEPGLSNKISEIFADKVAVSFEKKYDFSESKLVLTGNPIRKEILDPSPDYSPEIAKFFEKNSKNLPLIFITGGNQGSHAINMAVLNGFEELNKNALVIHQTGDSKFGDFDKLVGKQKEISNPSRYLPLKWVEAADFGKILTEADLVISRSGINTLLEIAYNQGFGLFVPLNKEQRKNAEYFKKLGMCQILDPQDLKNLTGKVEGLLKDIKRLKADAKHAREAVVLNGAEKITQEILVLENTNRSLLNA